MPGISVRSCATTEKWRPLQCPRTPAGKACIGIEPVAAGLKPRIECRYRGNEDRDAPPPPPGQSLMTCPRIAGICRARAFDQAGSPAHLVGRQPARIAFFTDDPAASQPQHAIGHRGDGGVVRDDDRRRAELAVDARDKPPARPCRSRRRAPRWARRTAAPRAAWRWRARSRRAAARRRTAATGSGPAGAPSPTSASASSGVIGSRRCR